jgi:elongator complex protein 2
MSSSSSSSTTSKDVPMVELEHCAAAAASHCHAITWVPPTMNHDTTLPPMLLAYASHALIYLCESSNPTCTSSTDTPTGDTSWKVIHTLRTRHSWSAPMSVITSLMSLPLVSTGHAILLCGFSNGCIHVWTRSPQQSSLLENGTWNEHVLYKPLSEDSHSITSLDGTCVMSDSTTGTLLVVTASSAGSYLFRATIQFTSNDNDDATIPITTTAINHVTRTPLLSPTTTSFAMSTLMTLSHDTHTNGNAEPCQEVWMVLGTAMPRHNQLHLYQIPMACKDSTLSESNASQVSYAGALSGHQDWITCGAWWIRSPQERFLATGSHDAKIRLWKFTTTTTTLSNTSNIPPVDSASTGVVVVNDNDIDNENDDDELEKDVDEEEEEEGESRLTLYHTSSSLPIRTTQVTLEALLYGHEDHVTSVAWHPHPPAPHSAILVSSSMDRSILLWAPTPIDNDTGEDTGIWTPLTRVGSAGGILGGSVGSTLLGYLHASLEPIHGQTLVGHAYGGSLHMWSTNATSSNQETLSGRLPRWRASLGITGHFGGVTDLCWEATRGQYLLTASQDQTCRLWSTVHDQWRELARPQVHGYDLSTVSSLSTPEHPHLMVSGADEKELRVFDAPLSTITTLHAATGYKYDPDPVQRTDRAFIPSLGLSNKASALDGAEEDKSSEEETIPSDTSTPHAMIRWPLECDLGAVSLWPEVGRLFGHNTELYCLTSTLAAQTHYRYRNSQDSVALVASSGKARDADAAVIRLWNVSAGKCVGQLAGHKSTVATMSFTPDGRFLVTSGKDRRLCVWKHNSNGVSFDLAWSKDSAHKRIIWATHVCPFDPTVVASGSRDGCVRIWKIVENGDSVSLQEQYRIAPSFRVDSKPDAVTALSFAPLPMGDDHTALLALGLESGRLELWKVSSSEPPTLYSLLDWDLCHGATVTKLAWKCVTEQSSWDEGLLLASVSMDHACRIYRIRK